MKKLLSSIRFWAFLAVLAVGAYFFVSRPRSDTKMNLGSVVRRDLEQRVTIAGSVNPNRKTVISAPYNGYVRNLYVKIGQQVKPGDPVVSIAQSLRGSSEDIFPLRAPFAGIVVQILRTEGEYVEQQSGGQGGNALVRIDDLTRIFVEARVPEIEIGKLKVGQKAVIRANAVLDRPYNGIIRNISLAALEQKDWDKSRVEFPVLIEITDNDAHIKPGMSVIIDIITNKVAGVLQLRHEFIERDNDKYAVVTEKGQKKFIEIGLQNEEAAEIKSGLVEGERVRQTDFASLIKDF